MSVFRWCVACWWISLSLWDWLEEAPDSGLSGHSHWLWQTENSKVTDMWWQVWGVIRQLFSRKIWGRITPQGQVLSLTVLYAVDKGLGQNILQSVVIDSPMYLLMVNLPDISNIAMSLYNLKVEDTATIHSIVYIAVLSLPTPPSPSPHWRCHMCTG